MKYINPGYKHEERCGILTNIAIISGYDLHLSRGFPDGTIPDVLRLDSSCGRIFLGEAKDTESPGVFHTRKRLLKNQDWFRLVTFQRRGSLFVLCVGKENDVDRWENTMSELALTASIKNTNIISESIDHENFLIIMKLL